jgi:FKBP-type peptidyl-prolyl cis-trans isomerase
MKRLIILFSLVLTTVACNKDANKNYDSENEADILKYIEANNLDAEKTPSGLYYVIEKKGNGVQPNSDNNVIVSYKSNYINGKPFAESDEHGQVFSLQNTLLGLAEGFALLNEGGEAKLILPSRLAFGNQDYNSVPAGSVLVFDVKIIATEEGIDRINENQITQYLEKNNLTNIAKKSTSGLYYIVDSLATGDKPNINSTVSVKYKGSFLNGDIFDETKEDTAHFILQRLIPGFQEGLLLMNEGSSGQFMIPSRLAYGFYGQNGIPPGALILFDIELIKVD